DVVVATSANSSSLPLTYRNDDARRDLSHIVDAFLMHNRDIHVPVEDSVVMTEAESVTPIRRSRGYAPLPVWLGSSDHCVLAVGAELKNTFALTRDGMAFLSAHIGDMGSLETQRAFEASVAQMRTAHRRVPELIVVDKHPGYATHAWGEREAERLGVPLLAVQHHHAHALALRAECPDGPPETSVVLDGTGYGDDETIWGGEILIVGEDPLTFERAWHLPGFWLAGGDSAIRHPWKSALGLLAEYGAAVPRKLAAAIGPDEFALVRSQLANHAGVVRTTSAGRVFDAIAALTGVCLTVTYEAQAAMELETVARRCPHDHPATATTVDEVVAAVLAGLADDRPVPCLAHQFHTGLVHVIARAVAGVAAPPAAIGLTGGVFANRLISDGLASELTTAGYTVRRHRVVPSNDGGLSLGQALAGLAALDAGEGRMKPLGHTKEAG
ncbi:MAG: Sua5/YciO/YrdC/YwlC family protein, partial [Actinomycetia bacterium]|nr:Sua5/YciO/YrdC/YwlC family protein [Actinomycetes bacterium]